ncbi:hypothetical protein F5141DRAFT_1066762 [Pisolithus sp. B1]|nr:hypothetical protein F5141DRAFT_1066762 [Pisolithus sp. B1]
MTPAVKQCCTCKVYQCIRSLDPDPTTQVPKPGHLLPASTVHQHWQDNKICKMARQTGQMELNVLMANSSSEMETDDPVISSWAVHGEAGNWQVAAGELVLCSAPVHESASVHNTPGLSSSSHRHTFWCIQGHPTWS